MTKKKIAELYEEALPVIRGKASSFHATTGWDYTELISLGNTIFMDALTHKARKWNPKKCSFRTWMNRRLTQSFLDHINKANKNGTLIFTDDIAFLDSYRSRVYEGNPVSVLRYKDMIAGLSDEAREVAMLLINGPAEALDIIGTETPRAIRGAIKRYLVKQGWSWPKIWRVYIELKSAVRAMA